ncbi:unnamed protein product [Dimorphilus gyrociliatus]|uniref:Uncharacterized protein n=1 Tax=Dimorphilus gyrociliatus TaxID=2664684 RepID=A0A7I8WB68_9ANNE|nr:unnamed protein product [Dimorphilus gyrociliatus]
MHNTDMEKSPGFGKKVVALSAYVNSYMPIISDKTSKEVRAEYDAVKTFKGARSMHRTTHSFGYERDQAKYETETSLSHGGNRSQDIPQRPQMAPCQHLSNFERLGTDSHMDLTTNYSTNYKLRPSIHRQHDKLAAKRMMASTNLKESLVRQPQQCSAPISQYGRVHHKLGLVLGPGVEHYRPEARRYNVLTGEDIGPTWTADGHKRVSGNRNLFNGRRLLEQHGASSFPRTVQHYEVIR